ncbi:MAG: hypothetical protein JWQ09_672 [Segetibacter sp.]|nr:hypothetical protein [Segetibacter sp.]
MQASGTQAHEGDCFVPRNDGAIRLSIVTFRGRVRRNGCLIELQLFGP